jgi:hypothetical protein
MDSILSSRRLRLRTNIWVVPGNSQGSKFVKQRVNRIPVFPPQPKQFHVRFGSLPDIAATFPDVRSGPFGDMAAPFLVRRLSWRYRAQARAHEPDQRFGLATDVADDYATL